MLKRELRKIFLAKRAALSTVEYGAKCVQLCNRLFDDIDVHAAKVIHTFLAIDKNKEPDTWLVINKLNTDYPHIRISVPRIITNTNDLENYYLDTLKQLVTNELGIPEPASGVLTPTSEIDIVLIPLITFDRRGHRVGYGKGFYDRFLQQCRADTLRVGLSLFEPVDEITDVYELDVPMHYCVTPEETFVFTPPAPAG